MRLFFCQFVPKSDVRANILPALTLILSILLFYWASLVFQPGAVTYVVSTVALLIIGLTALARVNDISLEQRGFRWQARRLGLVMVGAACLWLILEPLATAHHWPTWPEIMLRWGVALTWLTTPYMPPWWRYITGEFKDGTPLSQQRDLSE